MVSRGYKNDTKLYFITMERDILGFHRICRGIQRKFAFSIK